MSGKRGPKTRSKGPPTPPPPSPPPTDPQDDPFLAAPGATGLGVDPHQTPPAQHQAPPPTPSQADLDYSHVLVTVLGQRTDSALAQALLQGAINSIPDLLSAPPDDIHALTFSSGTQLLPLPRGLKTLVLVFQDYVDHLQDNLFPGDSIDWSAITKEDFDKFRISKECLDQRRTSGATAAPPAAPSPSAGHGSAPSFRAVSAPASSSAVSTYHKPADLFMKGIKRDPSLFPTIKDERHKDNWHRSFVTQARAQGIARVLDAAFRPADSDDAALFKLQQEYLFSVFEKCLLTDMGKSLVRKHHATADAQALYQEIHAHHNKSTRADIDASQILSYVTSVRIGDGSWKGTTHAFVLHWQNQIRIYDSLPTAPPVPSPAPEGSIKGPGHDSSRDSQQERSATATWLNTNTEVTIDAPAVPSRAGSNVLWNNMYAVLCED